MEKLVFIFIYLFVIVIPTNIFLYRPRKFQSANLIIKTKESLGASTGQGRNCRLHFSVPVGTPLCDVGRTQASTLLTQTPVEFTVVL